jgi:hypothetical protein
MEIKGLPEKIYSSNISIDNPDIARVMRQLFEIVWKSH